MTEQNPTRLTLVVLAVTHSADPRVDATDVGLQVHEAVDEKLHEMQQNELADPDMTIRFALATDVADDVPVQQLVVRIERDPT